VDTHHGWNRTRNGAFICLQWCEMRSGSKDTHDLAVAAGKQADAASTQVQRTETMGEIARAQAVTAIDLSNRTRDLADWSAE
jgi:hypothetical protein